LTTSQVGVVLGAGGVLGVAYHAGVLAALESEVGFDARQAALLVGTSAGSITGATLRAGVSPSDHLARVLDQPLSPEGRALVARSEAPGRPAPVRPRLGGLPLPADPLMALRALTPFGGVRPGVALAGVLPAGGTSTQVISDPLDRLHHDRWPDRPLWIVAVRFGDGRRVVLGRDPQPQVSVGTAAAASSAIPGFFEPVRVGRWRLVDGGAHSPTNADLVAGLGLDLVVVVSPMSATRATLGRGPSPRALHGRALAAEVAAIRRSGTPVLTIQPTVDDRALLSGNPMDPAKRKDVARTARRTATARLADPAAADRVALLRASR
jgi:NTE family protein